MVGGGTGVQIKKPGAHSPLINNNASIVYWSVILQTIVLRLLYFYEFINSSHEIVLSILDKAHVKIWLEEFHYCVLQRPSCVAVTLSRDAEMQQPYKR